MSVYPNAIKTIDIFYRYDNLHPKIYLSNFPSLISNKGWVGLMARSQISNDPSGRIIVSFPYDPLRVVKVKTIDGRRWHPAEKHWSFPDPNGTLEKILNVFEGEEIHIDPALQAKKPSTSVMARTGATKSIHI